MLDPLELSLNHRWNQLVLSLLSLCALAAGAACSGRSESAPSPAPAEIAKEDNF